MLKISLQRLNFLSMLITSFINLNPRLLRTPWKMLKILLIESSAEMVIALKRLRKIKNSIISSLQFLTTSPWNRVMFRSLFRNQCRIGSQNVLKDKKDRNTCLIDHSAKLVPIESTDLFVLSTTTSVQLALNTFARTLTSLVPLVQ